jgi:hypothetical protein
MRIAGIANKILLAMRVLQCYNIHTLTKQRVKIMQVQYNNTYSLRPRIALRAYCTTCGDLEVLYNMETDELEPCWDCEQNEANDFNSKAERV